MARPLRREIRPAEVRCIENGHRFTARVPHVEHTVEEGGPQDITWVVETTQGVTCQCGSPVEPV